MENIGLVLKKVRNSKGIKTKYVYEGILSRSMFYKFENGMSDISLNHFLAVTDRLNVAFNELEGLVDYHDGYKENLGILMTMHYKGEIDSLREYSKKLTKLYEEKRLIFYKHLCILADLLICYVTNEPFNEEEIQEVKGYLFKADLWMYYELSLFTNSLFIFDLDVIDILFKKVSNSLNTMVANNTDIFMLVANILSLCFQENDLNRIRKYIKILNNLSVKNDIMFSHFLKKFYTSLYGYAATGEERYEEDLKIHISYLESIDLKSMAESHRKLYELVKLNISGGNNNSFSE